MAKDLAAFANHLGGSGLIGVVELDATVAHYKGLSKAEVTSLKRSVEEAVRDRCSPHPVADIVPIPIPNSDRFVLAVNVPPSLALIGVTVKAPSDPRCRECAHRETGQSTYAFPVRTTTQTNYLEPEQLPMYMTAEVRRTALLLGRIPADGEVVLHLPFDPPDKLGKTVRFARLDEERNFFAISEVDDQGKRLHPRHYPLDQVHTVHAGSVDGTWIIYLKAYP